MHPSEWARQTVPEEIDLIRTLCAIPAFSGYEAQRADYILQWLRRFGGNPFLDQAGNVCLPFGKWQQGKIRVYAAHMDTVFPMDTELAFREEPDRLCAPGVGDDTANVAALMLLSRLLLTRKASPRQPVLIVFNTGEEGLGNLRGSREIGRAYGDRMDQFITFDGTYHRVVDRAVGSCRYRIFVRTEGGHSYGAFGHANAIHQAAEIIHTLYLQWVPRKESTKTTYNVGTIEGGTSVNTIAQDACFTYEYRSDDQACLQEMRTGFQGIMDGFRAMGWQVEVELLGERPCMGPVDPERQEQLLHACEEDILSVTGVRPVRGSSSTDANIPLSMGIPATSFGLYVGDQSHTREEWLETSSLCPGLQIGLAVLRRAFEGEM